MKQIILKTMIGSLLTLGLMSTASAATFNFAEYIDETIGEQGYANDSPFTWTQDNLKLTATAFYNNAASYVYMDSGNAGMGVCNTGLTDSSQCSVPSDDNITTGEVLTWNFDKSISALAFTLKDTNHHVFSSSIEYSTDSGNSWNLLSTDYSLAFTTSINDISFKTIGSASNEQFYMGAVDATVSAVPEPSTYALMLAGLGLVGFMARRRKQA
jgi:hypothetical protein